MLRGEVNLYESNFECLACSEGCEECVDDRACVFSIYTSLRYALLVVNCLVILSSLVFAALVYKYWRNKVKLDIWKILLFSGHLLACVADANYRRYLRVNFPSATQASHLLDVWKYSQTRYFVSDIQLHAMIKLSRHAELTFLANSLFVIPDKYSV